MWLLSYRDSQPAGWKAIDYSDSDKAGFMIEILEFDDKSILR